jgi:hypothetical protein
VIFSDSRDGLPGEPAGLSPLLGNAQLIGRDGSGTQNTSNALKITIRDNFVLL